MRRSGTDAPDGGARKASRDRTRHRILAELCGGRRTASELSEAFGISGSAARVHLVGLEDEGLVRRRVERRGVGKPTHVYEVTEDGRALLSRAYAPVLHAVLERIAARRGDGELEASLREAGRALAAERAAADGRPQSPARACAAALEALGGAPTAARLGAGWTVESACCPLASLSPRVPLVCKLLESLLAEVAGRRVRERCDRSDPPRCRFEVAGPAS